MAGDAPQRTLEDRVADIERHGQVCAAEAGELRRVKERLEQSGIAEEDLGVRKLCALLEAKAAMLDRVAAKKTKLLARLRRAPRKRTLDRRVAAAVAEAVTEAIEQAVWEATR